MDNPNKLSDHWKSIASAWSILTNPSRPSVGDMEIYKKHLQSKGKTGLNILILGSTPELRDLALSYKEANVVIVDINPEMMLAMTEFMENDSSREVQIRSNWLAAPLCENYFDIILADFTFENMAFENHQAYFDNIRKWLKNDGLYISRIFTFLKKYQPMTIRDIEGYCKEKPVNNELLSLFWAIAVFFTGDMITREIKVADFFQKLEEYRADVNNPDVPAIKSILAINETVFPKEKSWFAWDDIGFKDLIESSGLKIVSQECAKDVNMPNEYKDFAPIFLIRK
jgi:ubiquinone/menaquinone biosynthesis C-methylase UbiE